MVTMRFSVSEEIKKDFNDWAKRAKKSKGELFREMFNTYKSNHELEYFNQKTEYALAKLGIQTEEELYEYLESDETYQDRLRRQSKTETI